MVKQIDDKYKSPYEDYEWEGGLVDWESGFDFLGFFGGGVGRKKMRAGFSGKPPSVVVCYGIIGLFFCCFFCGFFCGRFLCGSLFGWCFFGWLFFRCWFIYWEIAGGVLHNVVAEHFHLAVELADFVRLVADGEQQCVQFLIVD